VVVAGELSSLSSAHASGVNARLLVLVRVKVDDFKGLLPRECVKRRKKASMPRKELLYEATAVSLLLCEVESARGP
jgi:hypothetical protein